MLRLAGLGTSFQVSMPRREENSASAALSHLALFGDRRSCFQVLGVSKTSSTCGDVEPTKLPRRLGRARTREDRRGGSETAGVGEAGGEVGRGAGGGDTARGSGGGDTGGGAGGGDTEDKGGEKEGGEKEGGAVVREEEGTEGDKTGDEEEGGGEEGRLLNMEGEIGRRAGL